MACIAPLVGPFTTIEAGNERSLFRGELHDVDARPAEMNQLGFETLWFNSTMAEHGIKYAYTQAPAENGGHIFEFVQGL